MITAGTPRTIEYIELGPTPISGTLPGQESDLETGDKARQEALDERNRSKVKDYVQTFPLAMALAGAGFVGLIYVANGRSFNGIG